MANALVIHCGTVGESLRASRAAHYVRMDANGVVQAILANPVKMRTEQTAKAARESAKVLTRVNIDDDLSDLNPANVMQHFR